MRTFNTRFVPQKRCKSRRVVYWKNASGKQKLLYWENLPTPKLEKLLDLSKMKDGAARRALIRKTAWLKSGGYSDDGFHDSIRTAIVLLHANLTRTAAAAELTKLQREVSRILDSCNPDDKIGTARAAELEKILPRLIAIKKIARPGWAKTK
jgi:hypothetical protein